MGAGRYRSLSGALVDPEKARRSYSFSSDDDAPDLISSTDPMLGQAPSKPSFAYHLPRRRFSRYFTLAIATTLLLLIVYLVKASWNSDAQVKLGLKKPPPPPPAWEQFPFLTRYHGGIRSLVDRESNVPEWPAGTDEEELRRLQEAAMAQKSKEDVVDPKEGGFQKREQSSAGRAGWRNRVERYNPTPRYAAEKVGGGEEGKAVKCFLNATTKLQAPDLLAYKGVMKGFPEPAYGSNKVLGLRDDVCFERFGRLGPYGFGYGRKYGGSGAGTDGEREGAMEVWGGEEEDQIDYTTVSWAGAQQDCLAANAHRFKNVTEKGRNHFFSSMSMGGPLEELASLSSPHKKEADRKAHERKNKNLLSRTAVIIRTWNDYKYDAEDIMYLRALINELSLYSSGEYTVHFMIHVKDDNLQIWADEDTYQQALDDALPAEFRGMGTLWSERQMGLIYGGVAESFYRDLPVHGAYRSTYMPVQYFAYMHPEYAFFWHWEMDVRYTGHFYNLFQSVSHWANQQPRKGLWERNGRFYVPAEHGTWEDFRQMVRVQTEHGTSSKASMFGKLGEDAAKKHPLDKDGRGPEKSVWGPVQPDGQGDETVDPEKDPRPPVVYEKDDYQWGVGEDADFITFNPLFDPHNTNWILAEDVTGYNTSQTYPPRRTAIITASRLSRRLLTTMHRETALKRHTMFSEMWPGSTALQHGLKAVYAPHPVYIDRAWPASYLAAIFNNGLHGAAGGARTSVFSDERQHNFLGTTWYYHAGHSPNLWRRWLGYKVDNDGGEEFEKGTEGRMCLPPMLLHPVKQVDLVYEHREGEE
ncbi:hypothetical protein B0A50_08346 [Salinomyces thailandicus]|uniref:Uncharacterized protein n=1 Tax=Salinomyces thailandicus TaxID=706561 RepID=A0A4U0TK05_9PEZI|nr:hypothetical protein B0A50_08346 [Salinomyces thailandica]